MANILITGGGTGGHLTIAKVLIQEFQNNGDYVIYVGSTNGQDRMWFENSEVTSYFLQTQGVVNKRGFGVFNAIFMQILAVIECIKIVCRHKIDAIVSVGGYSAGGASGAGILLRKKLFIHEQNATLGLLNKIILPFATNIYCSFDFKSRKLVKTSYPINSVFFANARIRQSIKCILFLGGSQGAVAINNFAISIALSLLHKEIKIIHQCGKRDYERVKSEYERLGILDSVILFDFDKNLCNYIYEADFAVSRSGASSLWELCANGLCAYFIPYPYAAKNHQYYNALELYNKGLCILSRQNELSKEVFLNYIDSINLSEISRKLISTISPDGAKQIVEDIKSKI